MFKAIVRKLEILSLHEEGAFS